VTTNRELNRGIVDVGTIVERQRHRDVIKDSAEVVQAIPEHDSQAWRDRITRADVERFAKGVRLRPGNERYRVGLNVDAEFSFERVQMFCRAIQL